MSKKVKKNRKLPSTNVQFSHSKNIYFEETKLEKKIFFFNSIKNGSKRKFVSYHNPQTIIKLRPSWSPPCQKVGTIFSISYYHKMEPAPLKEYYLISSFNHKILARDAYTLRLYKFESPIYVLINQKNQYLSFCPITNKMTPSNTLSGLELWDFYYASQINNLSDEYPQYSISKINSTNFH